MKSFELHIVRILIGMFSVTSWGCCLSHSRRPPGDLGPYRAGESRTLVQKEAALSSSRRKHVAGSSADRATARKHRGPSWWQKGWGGPPKQLRLSGLMK